MQTFDSIFKSNFTENFTAITLFDTISSIVLAFILGLIIVLVYRKTYGGLMYQNSFAIALIGMAMVTNMLILAVTSNVILSLGMVGALSIVRFRTAIKEPSDILFLFWAISVGIIVAAGFFPLAVIGTIAIALMVLVFFSYQKGPRPYILLVHVKDYDMEKALYKILREENLSYKLKSKTIDPDSIELNIEVGLADDKEGVIISKIKQDLGIERLMLVSYNGEYLN